MHIHFAWWCVLMSSTKVVLAFSGLHVPTRALNLPKGCIKLAGGVFPRNRASVVIPMELQSQSSGGDPKDSKTTSKHYLELDREGHLRIGRRQDGPVLLDGLSPSVWKGIRPSSGEENGLFLHTTHSKAKCEHEDILGNFVSCNRILACARVTRYWMGPAFGHVPYDTQFLLAEIDEDDLYALILPLVDSGFRASLNYGGRGLEVVCHSESGDTNVLASKMRTLYVQVGNDPYALLKTGFREVSTELGTFCCRDDKKIPASVDDFGWCTWDAFYSKVTPAGVLEGVKSLQEAGVPPKNLILDDGWQQVKPAPPHWEASSSADAVSKDSVLARLGDALLAAFAQAVEAFYEEFVQRAPHGSIGNIMWRFLARTSLRGQLWNYFDKETDFGRKLNGFPPNFKFQTDEKGDVKTLKDLVSVLKTQYGVKKVYCWHALHGYWRGLSKKLGETIGIQVQNVKPKPSNHLLRIEPQLAWDPVSLFGVGLITSELDLATFYNHVHTPLAEAGVDGVKVDVQSGVSAVGGGVGGGPHLARIYTEAMEASVLEHFSSDNGATDCINCMCHSTENLYRYRVTNLCRASDDFYPDRADSHTVHIINVAYNSLFLGEICLPDWDMFHSHHASAPLHAAARAVGGCPLYVSDAPGRHNSDLLRKLVLNGSILRAKLPGRPTRDCLFADVGRDGISALKIWNQNIYGGVVGAFNVQGVAWSYDTRENEVVNPSPLPVTAKVKPHDVETLRDNDGPFAVWRHRTSSVDILSCGESTVNFRLSHREWEILTIVPVQTCGSVSWAPIGLVNMLNSGGALLQAGQLQETNNTVAKEVLTTTTAEFWSKGPGRFGAYCEPAPSRILIQDTPVVVAVNTPFTYDKQSGKLSFVLPDPKSEEMHHQVTVVWDHE